MTVPDGQPMHGGVIGPSSQTSLSAPPSAPQLVSLPPNTLLPHGGNIEGPYLELMPAPEDFNAHLWQMILSIKDDTAMSRGRIDVLQDRITTIETEQRAGGQLAELMSADVTSLSLAVEDHSVRLERSNAKINRLQNEVIDCKQQSMKHNLII